MGLDVIYSRFTDEPQQPLGALEKNGRLFTGEFSNSMLVCGGGNYN